MRVKDFKEAIRWQVNDLVPQCTVMEYQPGNGSRYVIMFTRVPPAACEGVGCMRGSWLVALPDGAGQGHCAVFAGSGYLDPSYVAEKLHLGNRDDALVLTEIIGHVLSRSTPSALDEEAHRDWLVEHIQSE